MSDFQFVCSEKNVIDITPTNFGYIPFMASSGSSQYQVWVRLLVSAGRFCLLPFCLLPYIWHGVGLHIKFMHCNCSVESRQPKLSALNSVYLVLQELTSNAVLVLSPDDT